MTYDRGYALQTKSLLMENTTTTADAVVQLFEALGLRGSPSDYALEERNIVTGGIVIVSPIIEYTSIIKSTVIMETCTTHLDTCIYTKLCTASNNYYYLDWPILFSRNSAAWSNGDSTEPPAELWLPPVLHGAATGADEGHAGCSSTLC